MYEGGIREPLLIRWPGVTKPGSVSEALVSSPDFYPTLLSAIGQPLRPQQHQDGQDLGPALHGKPQKTRALYWHYPHYGNQGGTPASCIVEGDLKLIKWYEAEGPRYELFNLRKDIGEQQEVLSKNQKQGAQLKSKLEDFLKATGARFPAPNVKFTSNQ